MAEYGSGADLPGSTRQKLPPCKRARLKLQVVQDDTSPTGLSEGRHSRTLGPRIPGILPINSTSRSMRLVTWNCNLSLSRKLPRLMSLAPDLGIIQECERDLKNLPDHAQYLWVGNNARKGLGVISFGPPVSLDPCHRVTWSYFLPLNVPMLRPRLLATWAYNHRASRFGPEYNGMPLDVFHELRDWLSAGPTVVSGDFNNSVVWDRPNGQNNFAAVDASLRQVGLRSVYHSETGEPLGSESRGTYFHTKNADKPFHIDYVYAHRAIPIRRASIESFADWHAESDHVPIVIDTEDFWLAPS